MRRHLLGVGLLLGSSIAGAQTVDDIVAKAIAARGGMEKIQAVRTEKMEGHISFAPDQDGTLVVTWKRPGKFRQEVTMGGKTLVRATDGATAWTMNPFGESPEPQVLTGDEVSLMNEQADFDKPLVDYKKKGNRVELRGKEKVAGQDAYQLQITLRDGQTRSLWIDAANFLELKWQGKVNLGGKQPEFSTFFRDYRTVEGLKFPSVIDTVTGADAPAKQTITFEKIEINVPVEDSIFVKPAAAK